jgi:hypothetical protein
MDTENFPNTLKIAKVLPIFKAGDRKDIGNYRPISVLPILSKIYETVINRQLTSYLDKYNIINKNQFGFLKNSSTAGAAISLVNKIVSNIENNLKTSALFLDLRKAFDCLNFETLGQILLNIGIKDKSHGLLMSYLRDRSQFVKISDSTSDMGLIRSGVPQGSVLGPLLFLIYINDIFSLNLYGQIQCFADDTVIIYGEKDLISLKTKMTKDIEKLNSFLNQRNLSLNIQKTKFILFRTSSFDGAFYTVPCGNSYISCTSVYKYLGLFIDQSLSFTDHIKHVQLKISPYINILKRIRYSLNKSCLLNIYYAYINSQLTYLLAIWGSARKTHMSPLSFLHNKALRIINFRSWFYPTKQLYSDKLLSLNQLKVYQKHLLIYKIKNNLLKTSISMVENISVTRKETRSSKNLRLPDFKTSSAQRSFVFSGIHAFNSLPTHIKDCPLISTFKKLLKEHISKTVEC